VNDAERLSQGPTFRLIGSEQLWERGAALTSRAHSFETDLLTQDENLAGLAAINRELIAKVDPVDTPQRVVLDIDSTEIPVSGQQEQSAYNGHFASTCYHPLLLFNREGDYLAAKLRPGNVHSAENWDRCFSPRSSGSSGRGRDRPGRCRLRQAGALRPEEAEGNVRHSHPLQRHIGGGHRRATRAVLLVIVGGRAPDTEPVPSDPATAYGAVAASRVTDALAANSPATGPEVGGGVREIGGQCVMLSVGGSGGHERVFARTPAEGRERRTGFGSSDVRGCRDQNGNVKQDVQAYIEDESKSQNVNSGLTADTGCSQGGRM
jgi:Transposase DDE domain group 1